MVDSLPDEVLLFVFSCVASADDKLALLRVSARFRRIALDRSLWRGDATTVLSLRQALPLAGAVGPGNSARHWGQLFVRVGEEDLVELRKDTAGGRAWLTALRHMVRRLDIEARQEGDVAMDALMAGLAGSTSLEALQLNFHLGFRREHEQERVARAATWIAALLVHTSAMPELKAFHLLANSFSPDVFRAIAALPNTIEEVLLLIRGTEMTHMPANLFVNRPALRSVVVQGLVELDGTPDAGVFASGAFPNLERVCFTVATERVLFGASGPTPPRLAELEVLVRDVPFHLTYPHVTLFSLTTAVPIPPFMPEQMPNLSHFIYNGVSCPWFPSLFNLLPSLKYMDLPGHRGEWSGLGDLPIPPPQMSTEWIHCRGARVSFAVRIANPEEDDEGIANFYIARLPQGQEAASERRAAIGMGMRTVAVDEVREIPGEISTWGAVRAWND